jgi:hypothetical protein
VCKCVKRNEDKCSVKKSDSKTGYIWASEILKDNNKDEMTGTRE